MYELWTEALQSATTYTSAQTKQADLKSNTQRAIQLAHNGAYGKAAIALLSQGIHSATPEVLEALRNLHPQEHTVVDMFDGPPSENLPLIRPHQPFTVAEVGAAIENSPPASAAGASGLFFQHLK